MIELRNAVHDGILPVSAFISPALSQYTHRSSGDCQEPHEDLTLSKSIMGTSPLFSGPQIFSQISLPSAAK
jgi:hypothetical protein